MTLLMTLVMTLLTTLTMTLILTIAMTLIMTLIFLQQNLVINSLVLSGRCRDDDPKLLTNPYKKPISLLKG